MDIVFLLYAANKTVTQHMRTVTKTKTTIHTRHTNITVINTNSTTTTNTSTLLVQLQPHHSYNFYIPTQSHSNINTRNRFRGTRYVPFPCYTLNIKHLICFVDEHNNSQPETGDTCKNNTFAKMFLMFYFARNHP